MLEGTKVVVVKLENGFRLITRVAEDDGSTEREYAYPNFNALGEGMKVALGEKQPRDMYQEAAYSEQMAINDLKSDRLRDELGAKRIECQKKDEDNASLQRSLKTALEMLKDISDKLDKAVQQRDEAIVKYNKLAADASAKKKK